MAQEKQQEGISPNVPGGLNTDSALVTQPQGTTRFVFTGVNETKEGDYGFIANEESNQECYPIPTAAGVPYTPIGKVYIGDENNLLFLAHLSGNSIIAILDKECALTIVVDDRDQTEKLGFEVTQQIDATFRLRRGCERVVYWVDPKPRMFIIDKPEEFRVTDANSPWDISKFNLFKTYKKIPEVDSIEVLDGGGKLAPGSYNFSIQYLDEDFNPTEFVTSTETIMIYNSSSTTAYRDIRGATKEKNDTYLQFEDSTKAIKLVFKNNTLDTTYPFYRIAITEANAGGGLISDTKFTSEISTKQLTFIYTGINYESSGTQAEVTMFNNIIEKAQSIEQIENRLILGNTKGKPINFCKLQKYASKINADLVTRTVILSELDISNPKDPAAHFNGLGYMPGEIYSFGIVYIFEDNTTSPVFHIPGKNPTAPLNQIYSSGTKVYPMSNVDNFCLSKYLDNNTCGEDLFWGRDFLGNSLTDTPIRHHRFPLRTDHNIPFVTAQSASDPNNALDFVKTLVVSVTRNSALCPTECPEGETCTNLPADFGSPAIAPSTLRKIYNYEINYTEDSVPGKLLDSLDPYDNVVTLGENRTQNVNYFNTNPKTVYGMAIVVTNVIETFEYNATNPALSTNTVSMGLPIKDPILEYYYYQGTSTVTGMTYRVNLAPGAANKEDTVYTSEIFGIKFSNIDVPSLTDTSGQKITGYYIVRNERKEEDRTIVDSAVFTCTIKEKNFVTQGLLFPEFTDSTEQGTRVQKNILGIISPEYKFNDVKYSTYSKIIQQGEFKNINTIKSRTKINDVAPGSGYVEGKHKDAQRDDDGFTLQIKTRDTVTEFVPSSSTPYKLLFSDIKEVYYLAALENKLTKVKDYTNNDKEIELDVFNLAGDNRTGIITFNSVPTFNPALRLPYVYLYRDNLEPYVNFRLDPYYKDSQNPHTFVGTTTSSCQIFNGDSYITPIRYVNSIQYDIRMRKRVGKSSLLKIIIATVLTIGAAFLTIFTLGAGTPLLVAAGLALAAAVVGVATTLAISGIKQDAWNKVYGSLYGKGLRQTITDNYLKYDTDPYSTYSRGFEKNPEDDEIQWLGDCANLWFESAVNMGLRHGATDNTPDFLNAPSKGEAGTTYPEWEWEFHELRSVGSSQVPPTTALDFHMVKKLTYLDNEKKEGKAYFGLSGAEVYALNPDYKRRNKQKAYNALGLEYDCCSDCVETFPNRWYWSEQSFQEELTDNFRMFLPNNYKDLEAETGEITDIYRIQNNLYVHSAEGLWHCPQTFQERVTSDIISFIGTGEYFSVPPRKIVDDANSSAGNIHKWARTKTKFGVLFPSFKEKKWYLFDGQQLKPISDTGNGNYFKTHMDFLIEQQYYKGNLKDFPYSNNPSNTLGVGFLSTYDTNKERLIVTKKDFKITNLPESDYELILSPSGSVIFNNLSQTIATQKTLGWSYTGIKNSKLQFTKQIVQPVNKTVYDFSLGLPLDVHVYCSLDTTSLALIYRNQITAAVQTWYLTIRPEDTAFDRLHIFDDASERYFYITNVYIPERIAEHNGRVVYLSFTNESQQNFPGSCYHFNTEYLSSVTYTGNNANSQPTSTYINEYNKFTNPTTGKYKTFSYFKAVIYPITTEPYGYGRAYLQQSLLAVKTGIYTSAEANALIRNPAFTETQWNEMLGSLTSPNTNPYNTLGNGLEDYGFKIQTNRSSVGLAPGDPIITPEILATDLNELIFGGEGQEDNSYDEVIIETNELVDTFQEISGTPFVPQILNNGYTMSYSLKKQEWTSWHPYIPSFYMHVQEKFYSWPQGSTSLYKHNRPNHYQTFYGVRYPFIVEYVDNPSAMTTKIWSNLLFQTEAKKFDPISEEYIDQRYVTFNKALFYNTQQISGLLTLAPKQDDNVNYLLQQTNNTQGVAIIDRNERDWTMNSMRDIRTNYTVPMFLKDLPSLQTNYYIDKIVNPAAIDFNKDWTQLESFRDKYLVVRLIFDNFADTRLIFNFSALQRSESER